VYHVLVSCIRQTARKMKMRRNVTLESQVMVVIFNLYTIMYKIATDYRPSQLNLQLVFQYVSSSCLFHKHEFGQELI